MSNRYQTILFDLDSTLIDNKAASRSIFPSLRSQYPILAGQEERLFYACFGCLSGEEAYRALCEELGWEDAPAYATCREWVLALYVNATVCLPATVPTLQALRQKGYVLGVITNGDTFAQTTKLASGKLADYFDVIVISQAVGIKKPDPRIYEIALERLGAEKQTALFVGDNPKTDILGAQNAGIDSFLITDGENSCGATYFGKDISCLLEFL